MTERSSKLEFPGGSGDLLAGRLELPAGPARGFALFAHCFTCSKDIAAAGRISRALCQRGIGVLRFDFTGLGNSEGDFANTDFSSNVDDLVHAAAHLREIHRAPALLVGHSLGGAAVLAAAPRIAEVRAVATIGAPSEPSDVRRLLRDDLDRIEADGSARVELAGREFTIRKQFVDDLDRHRVLDSLRDLKRALLIFHSPIDEIVPIDHARRIYEAARHPKSFVSLDDADHLLSNPADSEYVGAVLSAWASRYFPASDGETPAGGEDGVVSVTEAGGRFAQRIVAGRHELTADEPVALGGADTGPNPYDLLLASLGACTSMTLRMYARHKGWPLRSIATTLRHAKIHAEDCASCETKVGKIDRIERVVRVEGELSAEQRARLLEIADRCPVHRTLEGEKEVLTVLDEGRGL